jgi:hypothetical protein
MMQARQVLRVLLALDIDKTRSGPAELRVRAAIHAAHVMVDADGPTGEQVIRVFRLLDSDRLRKRLRQVDGPLVVAVTEDVYNSWTTASRASRIRSRIRSAPTGPSCPGR